MVAEHARGKEKPMAKLVSDVMEPTPRSVFATQTLQEAAQRMRDWDVGVLPVVDDNGLELVAVVTDRDIVVRGIAAGCDPTTTLVTHVASQELVTLAPDQDLDDAVALMAHHQVRRLPVVDDGALVGIVSQADVAHNAPPEQVGETLEEISRPSPVQTTS
jgi:CBS domain-containing protein